MRNPSLRRRALNWICRYGIVAGIACTVAATWGMAQSTDAGGSMLQGLTAQNSAKGSSITSSAPSAAGASLMPGNYKIGEGDVLNVNVFDTPEFSGIYAVSDKEEINFPLLGILRVGGMRANELAILLQGRLVKANILRYPQVNVIVSSFASQGISVLGEVAHPGIYATYGSQRLLDIISLASGFTPLAGSTALIRHRGEESAETVAIRSANGEISDSEVQLEPGDTIIVQRASVVYVMGEVGKPGGFVMDRGKISVLQGIALAGGPLKTSSHNLVIVHASDRAIGPTAVNLDRVMRGKTPNPILESGDILYVPNSMIRTVAQIGVPGVISATASAVIYSQLR